MSEFLANLLRLLTHSISLSLLAAGLYLAGAGLAADAALDRVQVKYSAALKKAGSDAKARRATLEKIARHRAEHSWPKLTWKAAWLPEIVRSHSMVAFPILNFGKRGLKLDTKALQSRHRWVRERVIWHQASFLLMAGLLILLNELALFPLLRSRMARALATDDAEIFGKPKILPRGDGFVLSHDVRLARDGGGNPHVLTVGPSGNGKSACQVIPSLLQLPDDCAAVVTDPKGELHARTSHHLRKRGHEIIMLGPLAGHGQGWDPLRECQHSDDVRELARQLIAAGDESATGGSGNWNNMSRTLLSAYLLQAKSEGLGLADGLQLLYSDEAKGESITDAAAQLDYRQFQTMAGSANTAGSVLATIQGSCQVWLQDRVVGWMDHPERFSMSDIRSKKAVVYLITSANDMKASRPIQWVFFSRLFAHLASGDGGTPVRVFLDEMANLGPLEGLDNALNLLRSAGVALHGFIQNPSQLFLVYGRDAGAVVAESFGTICVMSGLRNDANDLARLLGERAEVRASYSTMDEKMRAQFSENQKQALDGSMLRQIRRDQVLIVCNNRKPVMGLLVPWFKLAQLRKLVPEAFRPDWSAVPEAAKRQCLAAAGAIEPVQIVLPEKQAKEKSKEKPAARKAAKQTQAQVEDLLAIPQKEG